MPETKPLFPPPEEVLTPFVDALLMLSETKNRIEPLVRIAEAGKNVSYIVSAPIRVVYETLAAVEEITNVLLKPR